MIEYNVQEMLTSFWPEWKIIRHLGQGGYGNVYHIRKEIKLDGSTDTQDAALKVICIPKEPLLLDILQKNPNTESAIMLKNEFETTAQALVHEITIMKTLQNSPYIVTLQDYYIYQNPQNFSRTIFIRMELLDSLLYFYPLPEKEILKLGINICSALEECSIHTILHRDIKPSNIFMNSHGNYKLGDFGISKILQSSEDITTQSSGTPNFMAPEVLSGKAYDCKADLYSLGLVMYTLLNENRLPFIPIDKQICSYQEHLDAFRRRMDGEVFPSAVNASNAIMHILHKACAFHPQDRYVNASEMRDALQKVYSGEHQDTSFQICSYRKKRILPIIGIVLISVFVSQYLIHTIPFVAAEKSTDILPSQKSDTISLSEPDNITIEYHPIYDYIPSTVFTYQLSEDGTEYTITGLLDSSISSVTIPDFYDGIPVTAVGENAFIDSDISAVHLPDSIRSIEESAFANCQKLVYISLPQSLQRIEKNAFYYSGIAAIKLPASVTYIGPYAFTECNNLKQIEVDNENRYYHSSGNCLIETNSKTLIFGCQTSEIPSDGSVSIIHEFAFFKQLNLHAINIPENIVSIEKYAFTNVRISQLHIPSTLISIHETAFNECTNVETITVHADNPVYTTVGKCIIENTSGTLIAGFPMAEIPSDGSVYRIGPHAFYNMHIDNINIPDSVQDICNASFNGSDFSSFRIPEGIPWISENTFHDCKNLKSIVIPASVTEICKYAFHNCSQLKTVYYTGTASQWGEIHVDSLGNSTLLDAEIIFISPSS